MTYVKPTENCYYIISNSIISPLTKKNKTASYIIHQKYNKVRYLGLLSEKVINSRTGSQE